MSQAAEKAERERDFERFLTFVDAVVAIAITLLVLPLVELSVEVRNGESVNALLREHQAQFWAFLLSFTVIARLWFIQHRSVRHVLYFDPLIANLTVLWMLTIVLLPFPTSLVAAAGDDPTTQILYVGTIALGTAFLGLAEQVTVRHPELSDGLGMPNPSQAWVNVGLMVVALALMLAFPALSYFPLLLLAVDNPVLSLTSRLRGRAE